MITNEDFLSTIFDRLDTETEAIGTTAFTKSPDDGPNWSVRTPSDANHKALVIGAKAVTANTYYCIAALKRAEPLSRAKGAVARLFVVPLDDIGTGPGSKTRPEEVPLEPTYKIETSEGNFQYGYLLAEPMTDLMRATALVKGVSKIADEGGSAVTKLIRMPVGVNNKRKYPQPWNVRCTDWHPERRFTEAELVEAFGVDMLDLETYRELPPGASVGTPDDDLFDWLLHTGQVVDPVPSSRGFVKIICPWGHTHSDGRLEAVYSPLGVGGPEHEGFREFKCQHDHCKERTWVGLAHKMFLERFVLNRGAAVLDLMHPAAQPMKIEAFRTWARNYSYKAKDAKAVAFIAEQWLAARLRKDVDTENFNPGAPRLYTDLTSGLRTFNTFNPLPQFPETRDTRKAEPIIEQIKYLFKDQFENAMAFIAWTVLRPEVRLQFALLHISPHHGTGRGWFKTLMARLLGQDYVRNPTLHDFVTGQFNEWLYRSLFLTFDEVRQREVKYRVSDRMRELITERRMMINRKGLPKFEADIFCNIMFLSNHLDALQIPDNDRRLWIVVNYDAPQPPAWYSWIYEALWDNEAIQQFYWMLPAYLEKKDFNPNGRAPYTKFAEQARDAGKSELEVELTELVRRLRSVGVRAIYKKHLYEVCKQCDVHLPGDITSRAGGGSPKERAQFWAIMSELNVVRTKRVLPTVEARRAEPSLDTVSEILVLDLTLASAPLQDAKAAAEQSAQNRFLVKQLETSELTKKAETLL